MYRQSNRNRYRQTTWRTAQPEAYDVTVRHADGTTEVVAPDELPQSVPYWRSPEWRELRRRVLRRDGGRCTHCHRRTGDADPRLRKGKATKLEIHHKTYVRYGHERLDDLVTLCQRCHSIHHTQYPAGSGV